MKPWRTLAGRVGSLRASPARWVAFAVLALCLFLLTGVLTYSGLDDRRPTTAAQHLVAWIYRTFGLAGTIFGLFLVILWAARVFLSGLVPRLGAKAIGVAGVVVSVCGLSGTVAYVAGGTVEAGQLGQAMAEGMVPLFSRSACVVIFTAMLVGALLLATNWFFLEEFRGLVSQPARGARFRLGAGRQGRAEAEVTSGEVGALVPPPASGLGRFEEQPGFEERQPETEEEPVEEFEEAALPAEAQTGDQPDLESDEAEEPVRGQRLLWLEKTQEPVLVPRLDRDGGEPEEEVEYADPESLAAVPEAEIETQPVKFAVPAGNGERAAGEAPVEIPRPDRAMTIPVPDAAQVEREEHAAGPSDPSLVDQAAPLIIQSGRASITLLQRTLQIRFSQASQLMEDLERAGVVGPYRGSLPREIRMTMEQWQRLRVGDRP